MFDKENLKRILKELGLEERVEKVEAPKILRDVNILWADPYGHFHQLKHNLKGRGIQCLDNLSEVPGSIFKIHKNIEIYYSGKHFVPKGEFDLCLTSMTHSQGYSKREGIEREVVPFLGKAPFMLYRDCCHGKAAEIAAGLGASHAVSTAISYDLMAEMVFDMLNNEYEYIKLGTDFQAMIELAGQKRDHRKIKVYMELEARELKDRNS